MKRRDRIKSPLNFYHITKRGVCKANIFRDDYDRIYFIDLIRKISSRDLKIHCFCLMDNHLHLLIESNSLNTLSCSMQLLFSRYASYFNIKYDRDGSPFKGRFDSESVNTWIYFWHCVKYILRNPIEKGILDLDSYKWSSFSYYYSSTKDFVTTSLICKKFSKKSQLLDFIKKSADFYVENNFNCNPYRSLKVRERGKSIKKRVISYVRSRYNIYNPIELTQKERINIAIEIHEKIPEIPISGLAESLKISRMSIYRHLKK